MPSSRRMRAWTSTQAAIDFIVQAGCGLTSTHLATAGSGYKNLDYLKAVAPHFTTINAGLNDFGLGTPVATYIANVQADVAAALLTGDVLLIFPTPQRTESSYAIPVATYNAAAKQLAAQMGVAFLSLWEHYDSGFTEAFGARLGDGNTHPSAALYAEIADIEYQVAQIMIA